MEPDRYQQNKKLFVLGIVCLLLSLTLFAFGFYILPFLFWKWNYNVPDFVIEWLEWLEEGYGFTHRSASWLLLSLFLLPATICVLISDWVSNHIDNQIYSQQIKIHTKSIELRKDTQETLKFSVKVLLLLILVLLVVSFVNWLITLTV